MEKVTIHRALSELKLIGNKINKQIQELEPSGIVQKDKLVNGVYKKEDFEKNVNEKFQSLIDLIDRRVRIKAAIVKSNGETTVTVAGKSMTVADAITAKSYAETKRELISQLTRKHNFAKAQIEKNNALTDERALQLATVALGKQGIKIGDDDAKRVVDPYLEANRFSLVDPLGVENVVAHLQEDSTTFEAEVDAVLSEANAITVIEI